MSALPLAEGCPSVSWLCLAEVGREISLWVYSNLLMQPTSFCTILKDRVKAVKHSWLHLLCHSLRHPWLLHTTTSNSPHAFPAPAAEDSASNCFKLWLYLSVLSQKTRSQWMMMRLHFQSLGLTQLQCICKQTVATRAITLLTKASSTNICLSRN